MNTANLYSQAARGLLTRAAIEDRYKKSQEEQEATEDQKLAYLEWLNHPTTIKFVQFLENRSLELLNEIYKLSNLDQPHELKVATKELETITKTLNYARTQNFSATGE